MGNAQPAGGPRGGACIVRNLRMGGAGPWQVAGSWGQPFVPVRNPQDSGRRLCTSEELMRSFLHLSNVDKRPL